MPRGIDGKTAFITGAARGQGRAHALRLAREGADIIAFDICGPLGGRDSVPSATPDDLAETVRQVTTLGRRIVTIEGDTRNFSDLQKAVDVGLGEFGGIDIVVANAGTVGGYALAHDLTEADWQTTIDINLTGVWLTAKAALPSMIEAGKGGCIVLISSGAGIKPMEHLADYSVAKAGVIHLTKVLALENGRHGIRVNCVAPGNVDTPMFMNDTTYGLFRPDLERPTRADVEEIANGMKSLNTKPFLDAEDIANAVLWLASDEGAMATGIVLSVDMGIVIG